MHTIPFWSDAVRQELCFSEKAQIVGCELAETCEPDFDKDGRSAFNLKNALSLDKCQEFTLYKIGRAHV